LIYLLSNQHIQHPFKLDIFEWIEFNPWGFSRLGIEQQVHKVMQNKNLQVTDKIILSITPLFFGRRGDIAFNALQKLFPNVNVVQVKEDQLHLFLNNLSV
jgi:hypothetical protein